MLIKQCNGQVYCFLLAHSQVKTMILNILSRKCIALIIFHIIGLKVSLQIDFKSILLQPKHWIHLFFAFTNIIA